MISDLENRNRFYVAGHRGYRAKYPENTLLSFKEAFELGVDMIELDIFLSKDDVLMIRHDSTLNTSTNGIGNVCDYTCEELKMLDAGIKYGKEFEGLKIPTLEEVCQLMQNYPGKLINVESKRDSKAVLASDLAVEILKKYGILDNCVFNCFDADVIAHVHDTYHLKTHGYMEECMTNFVKGENGTYSKMWTVGLNMKDLTPQRVKEFNDMGILAWCWCPDDDNSVNYALDCGATLATCNEPRPAMRIAKERGLR